MVIDDDQLDLFVAQRLMTREGFADQIISVDSASKGILYLQHEAAKQDGRLPSLIFLDITMPDVNGFDFLELYAKLENIKRRNVIVLSSTLDAEDIARAKANPYVLQFVQKPITSHLKEIGTRL